MVVNMNYRKNMIWLLVLVTAIDRLITIPFFAYESNPTVLFLGPYWWVILSVGLLSGLVFLWFRFEGWKIRTVSVFTGVLILLTSFAAVSNLFIVLS